MLTNVSRRWKGALAVAAATVLLVGGLAILLVRANAGSGKEFVTRQGDHFVRDGRPFATAGANNYRLMFLDKALVDLIMSTDEQNQLRVLRAWACSDLGLADGTGALDFANRTTYFHFWGGAAPAFNE